MQNELTELYNVLTLLKPGIFKTLKEFRAAHVTPGKPHQPVNPERLRELIGHTPFEVFVGALLGALSAVSLR